MSQANEAKLMLLSNHQSRHQKHTADLRNTEAERPEHKAPLLVRHLPLLRHFVPETTSLSLSLSYIYIYIYTYPAGYLSY